MQAFAQWYDEPPSHEKHQTIASVQPCLRVNDIDFLGDGSHLAYFQMLGLFSFGKMSVKEAINFWLEFLYRLDPEKKIDRITIHPEKYDEWKQLYPESFHPIIVPDSECIWSDGHDASGFCTEFYIDGIEVGNIVNTKGTMIDCGFGLERLDIVYNKTTPPTEVESLVYACNAIINSGFSPASKGAGYILRKLLRRLHLKGGSIDHEFFTNEVSRHEHLQASYEKLKNKHKNKTPEWWFDTYGIDLSLL